MILVIARNLLNQLGKDRLVKVNFVLSVVMNFGLWILVFWQSKNLAQVIPLHYNIYFGIDSFGPWYQLFFLPAIGLAVIAVNFLAALLAWSQKILSYFLISSSTVIQIFLILSMLAILINV